MTETPLQQKLIDFIDEAVRLIFHITMSLGSISHLWHLQETKIGHFLTYNYYYSFEVREIKQ